MERIYVDFIEAMKDYDPAEGLCESPVQSVYTAKYSRTSDYVKRPWRASLAIIAQGRKEVVLENEIFHCDPAHYTATPIPLPVISRIAAANSNEPFLGILIELEPNLLSEVARQIKDFSGEEPNDPPRAMFNGKAEMNIIIIIPAEPYASDAATPR